jgi:uncharacterized membrane protein
MGVHMIHNLTGLVHVLCSAVAIAAGAAIFFIAKGGALHRSLGWTYISAMVALNATALSIYLLTGGFNFLHAAGVISLFTVLGGLLAIKAKARTGALNLHYALMCWSYVGLIAALIAELSTRLVAPAIHRQFGTAYMPVFWITVAGASALVVLVGGFLIKKHQPARPAA